MDADTTAEAIDRLVLAGVIDATEAADLRARHAAPSIPMGPVPDRDAPAQHAPRRMPSTPLTARPRAVERPRSGPDPGGPDMTGTAMGRPAPGHPTFADDPGPVRARGAYIPFADPWAPSTPLVTASSATASSATASPDPEAPFDPPPRAAPRAPDAVAAAPPSYEPFAGALLRIWGSLRAARQALRTPRVLVRLGIIALTLLVIAFWSFVAFALLSPLPAPLRPSILMTTAGLLAYSGHRRAERQVDLWSIVPLVAAAAVATLAVPTTPWTLPYPLLVVGGFLALMVYFGTRPVTGPGAVLPALPVLAVPPIAVWMVRQAGLPMLPLFVALALVLLVLATVTALPVLHRPGRTRFTWRMERCEPVTVACGVMLLWVLPATVDRLDSSTLVPAFPVLFVLLTLVLYGLRVRALVPIAIALVAPVVFLLYAVLVLLGPFGWLLSGVALGAFGVWLAVRKRLTKDRGAEVPPAEGSSGRISMEEGDRQGGAGPPTRGPLHPSS